MDWLDLLAVQGTLKSLLQHHSSKTSILLCSAFFIVQLSHPYMTTGKSIALTRRTYVGKVMSLIITYTIFSIILKTFLYANGLIPSHRNIVVTAILGFGTYPYSFILCPHHLRGKAAALEVWWAQDHRVTDTGSRWIQNLRKDVLHPGQTTRPLRIGRSLL